MGETNKVIFVQVCLPQSHKTFLEGVEGSPHFPGISACYQIREAPEKLLSASVKSQMPSV